MRFGRPALVLAVSLTLCACSGPDLVQDDPSPTRSAAPSADPKPRATPEPERHTLRGTFTVLWPSRVDVEGEPCIAASTAVVYKDAPAEGYEDIGPGAAVTVYDGSQDIIATTFLSEGSLVDASPTEVDDFSNVPEYPDVPGPEVAYGSAEWEAYEAASEAVRIALQNLPTKTVLEGTCQFTFEAQVGDADFYSVEVANRGKVNFSRAEVEAADWTVALVL